MATNVGGLTVKNKSGTLVGMSDPDRLLSYPFIVVRIACTRCSRKGSYRLARLAERYGADVSMVELLHALSADCRFRQIKRVAGHYETCGAHFPDLSRPEPPDMPPTTPRLRVVKGSRAAE